MPAPAPVSAPPEPAAAPDFSLSGMAWMLLSFLASLRLTVVVFVLSFILVFYGTWAMVDMGNHTAVERYFRSWFIVWIPLKVIFMRAVDIPGAIPYPGGWLLGGLLLTNLLAAHAVRFKVSLKRSGILLIHSGLVLMMLGEFVAGVCA